MGTPTNIEKVIAEVATCTLCREFPLPTPKNELQSRLLAGSSRKKPRNRLELEGHGVVRPFSSPSRGDAYRT